MFYTILLPLKFFRYLNINNLIYVNTYYTLNLKHNNFFPQADDSETFKTIVAFECRGMEPVEFSPRVSILYLFHLF